MMHGPCGSQNPKSPCVDRIKNMCTKSFPKEYCSETKYKTNGYPLYRRRGKGIVITYRTKKLRIADNR